MHKLYNTPFILESTARTTSILLQCLLLSQENTLNRTINTHIDKCVRKNYASISKSSEWRVMQVRGRTTQDERAKFRYVQFALKKRKNEILQVLDSDDFFPR